MAKLNEEIIVIKVSTLLADNAPEVSILNEENTNALAQIIQQFAGDNPALVEVERA